MLAAVPERLESAGAAGIPQVVSLGALDMVNFGPMDSVPERYRDRNLYVHNPTITLMRTTPDECREIGRIVARKLNAATGPTVLFVPLRGVSMIATEGQAFHDPEADEALFSTLREEVDTARVEVHELDIDVNDPEFALAMANRLHELMAARGGGGEGVEGSGGDDRAPGRVGPSGREGVVARLGSVRHRAREETVTRSWSQDRPCGEGRGDDAKRGTGAAARGDRRGPADHRRRRRHRALGEVRRGRRHRPDHHLQLGPLPDGRTRLALRAPAVRRRERDRRRHGARGAPDRRGETRCSPASAAPTRSA